MPFYLFQWNDEVLEHIAEHGVTPEEFEAIVSNPQWIDISRSSGRPIAFGTTDSGVLLACVYEVLDELMILPVTAYEVD